MTIGTFDLSFLGGRPFQDRLYFRVYLHCNNELAKLDKRLFANALTKASMEKEKWFKNVVLFQDLIFFCDAVASWVNPSPDLKEMFLKVRNNNNKAFSQLLTESILKSVEINMATVLVKEYYLYRHPSLLWLGKHLQKLQTVIYCTCHRPVHQP